MNFTCKQLQVTVTGSQGHAGTVPMSMRRDPMAASAELIVSLESLCKHPERLLTYEDQCGSLRKESFTGLVCTVGELSAWPSASNVIPGQAPSLKPIAQIIIFFFLLDCCIKRSLRLQFQVYFTVDVRAVDDHARDFIVSEYSNRINKVCEHRMVNCTTERKVNDSHRQFKLLKANH